jgi:hypothetical protein
MKQLTKLEDATIKQRKWLKKYLEYGSARKAAMEVYDCTEESAGVIGFENLNKLNIVEAMEEAGITTHKLFKVHNEGLEANKIVSALKTKQEASADSDDFIEIPDFAVRHKYLETAYKLKKMLVDRQEVTGADGQPITIVVGKGYIPADTIIDATPVRSDAEQLEKV